uniref:Uncharacterized protein n=1 Tax=Tetraselmis sp. GSL018 TaxID=582737 RepID=A0A061RJK5_9CHLO|mmetsp:Transcript_37477/g.89082  ORF Transcript_37477/g.89082 Transcript_37477/m.89082 type:complete len:220 (-) Transcript_37477:206-865(-)|eukprot:CAMPEP_0177583264 /NCGR_PEP_ID=MMETSP0419_2-20121207/3225_1 /TAXON_ID=582737 /ORGANISM="Tetraselmis sp., Strain GSL018" /LENGTH=219 /DNA_ID=CAMNT_0019072635 /DNA_START=148 /DNA_END=807 /DNA_ORIENTATION=+
MVGAPGYDSGRSVLVICLQPLSRSSLEYLKLFWKILAVEGKILLSISSIEGNTFDYSNSNGVEEEELKEQLENPILLDRALGFRGVSYDSVLLLGDEATEKVACGTNWEPSPQVTKIVLEIVRGNKYVAAVGDGVVALHGIDFRGRSIIKNKTIACPEPCYRFLKEKEESVHRADPGQAILDGRLLSAHLQDSLHLCELLRDVLLKEDSRSFIPPYLQD